MKITALNVTSHSIHQPPATGPLHSQSVINGHLGGKLDQNKSSEVSLESKSLAYVIGEQVFGPAIDTVGSIASRVFNWFSLPGAYAQELPSTNLKDSSAVVCGDLEMYYASLKEHTTEYTEIADLCNRFGMVYEKLEDSQMAFKYISKALDIRMKIFGDNDLKVAEGYNNRGRLWLFLEQYEKALEDFIQAYKLRSEFGAKDRDITETYSNIIQTSRLLNRPEEAIKAAIADFSGLSNTSPLAPFGTVVYQEIDMYYPSLLEKREEYAEIASICNQLGLLYAKLKDGQMAFQYLDKALDIGQKLFDASHKASKESKFLADTYSNRAHSLSLLERPEEAKKAATNASKIAKEHLGDDHPYTQETPTTLLQ